MRYVYMLNRLRYSILLLTIIFTHFTDAAAQGTSKHKAKITGIVTDENHDPIELATVRIEKPVLVGTTTDLRGHYSISVDTQDSVEVVRSTSQSAIEGHILVDICYHTLYSRLQPQEVQHSNGIDKNFSLYII